MVLEVTYLYNQAQIVQLNKILNSRLLFINGKSMSFNFGSNEFVFDDVSMHFRSEDLKEFQINLSGAPYYFNEIVSDDINYLGFYISPIEMGSMSYMPPTFPSTLNFQEQELMILKTLNIYGIKRERQWNYEKKLSFFKEPIDVDVSDSYNTVSFWVMEFTNGLKLMLFSDRGFVNGSFSESKIENWLSQKFSSDELDLAVMEKYYQSPNFPFDIPDNALTSNVNKYLLLYQIK